LIVESICSILGRSVYKPFKKFFESNYPYILKTKNKLIMFYNGNGFGKTGIGYAIEE
jgi:hypothetical protein